MTKLARWLLRHELVVNVRLRLTLYNCQCSLHSLWHGFSVVGIIDFEGVFELQKCLLWQWHLVVYIVGIIGDLGFHSG